MNDIRRNASYLLIIAAGSMWGTVGMFARFLNVYGVYDLQISEMRFIFTSAILAVFIAFYKRSLFRIHLRDLWCFAGAGLMGLLLFNFCYYHTVEVATLNIAAGLVYTAPMFSMLLARVLFKERITVKKVAALVVTLLGCLMLSGMVGNSVGMSLTDLGIGMTIGLAYAFFSIFQRCAIDRGYHPLTITFYTFVLGMFGCSFICDFGQIADGISSGPACIWIMVANALLCTVVPYLLYAIGLKHVELSLATIFSAIEPVVASLLGFLLFAEAPTPVQIVGMAMIIGAVLSLSVFPLRKRRGADRRARREDA